MISRLVQLKRRMTGKLFETVFAGSNVHCLLCAWNGKRFMPPGAACPRCGSLSRHRLLPYSLRFFSLDPRNRGLLHVGANIVELGLFADRLLPSPYYRLDNQRHDLMNLEGDVRAIPLAPGAVDFAIAWHVLEHVPDDRAALRELHRVLSPRGVLVVSVPIFPRGNETTIEDPGLSRERFLEVNGHPDHARSCGLDYGERIKEAGFSVRRLRVADDVAPPEQRLFGLSPGHVAWCAAKEP